MFKDILIIFICYAVNTSEIIASLREIVNRKPDKKLKPKKLARIWRFGVVFDTKNAKPHFIFFSS